MWSDLQTEHRSDPLEHRHAGDSFAIPPGRPAGDWRRAIVKAIGSTSRKILSEVKNKATERHAERTVDRLSLRHRVIR
jgi:hypothetical protein